ncbi:hypothetical protein JJQ72_01425 [Paenibacillus sp. F411]|uniref:hypothetical protein n=1 Tax=Paenibacillus sp. F411 TaxID=2820239 RepID=UPI001AAE1BC8|nr:hypothetical protein [Paenibacillus sp. F411]MBO2942644.1 hypothetical protein [Paenibacillus sp. F411]
MLNKLIVLLLMAVISCYSSGPNEPLAAKSRPTPSATENVNSEPFAAQISIPKQVKANEEFVISAELQNKTGRDLEITTGSTAYYYVVWDSDGKVINSSIAREDIGVVRPMSEGDIISEKSQYRIKKPGTYEISGIAEFSIQNGGKSEVYKIETARKSIQVN